MFVADITRVPIGLSYCRILPECPVEFIVNMPWKNIIQICCFLRVYVDFKDASNRVGAG